MTMNRVFLGIIVLQFLIIGIIGGYIYTKTRNNGFISVNEIDSGNIIHSSNSALDYFYEPAPGIIKKKLDWINTNGPNVPTYKINEDTLNQVKDIESTRSGDVFRIVTLGDSFTFGENVNTEDNYPSQLQKKLDDFCKEKFEVINLGVGGYDVQYSVERYKIRGMKYSPDLLIWLFISEDLLRINEKLIPEFRKNYLNSKENTTYYENIKNGRYYKDWTDAQTKIVSSLGGVQKVLNLQGNYFNDLNNLYNKSLLIVTFPDTNSDYKTYLKSKSSEVVGSGYYYDGIPSIHHIKNAALPDGHPSEFGYKLIVDKLFEYIKNNDIIPCSR